MQPLHHKKYVSMNIILSQRIYFVIINSETQICKIKVTIENKSLNMKIKKGFRKDNVITFLVPTY